MGYGFQGQGHTQPLQRACTACLSPASLQLACRHLAGLLAAGLLGASLAGAAQAGPLRNRDGCGTAPAARPAATTTPLPVLQSVRVPTTGPATAMIDGQSVQASDTVGGLLVQAIDRLGITLAGRAGPRRVLLLGGCQKQLSASITTSHDPRHPLRARRRGRR